MICVPRIFFKHYNETLSNEYDKTESVPKINSNFTKTNFVLIHWASPS